MRNRIFSIMAGLLVVAGCAKESAPEHSPAGSDFLVLKAGMADLTKTDINEGNSTWEAGDIITVVYDGAAYEYVAQSAGETTTFTSTAGIAHAAIVGHLMDLPMGYVRSGAKDHGRQNQIEGRLEKGQKVVVVEDLISTGGSCIEVVNVLREAGAEVLGIVSIFTYGMQKGLTRLAEADVKNVSLTNFDVIAEVAAEDGYIEKDDVKRLIAFRNNPSDESWIGA